MKKKAHNKTIVSAMIGQKFERFTVIGESVYHERKKGKWLQTMASCKCDCGRYKSVLPRYLKSGRVKSCGCYGRGKLKSLSDGRITHGLSNHPLFSTWNGMIYRCTNTKCKQWNDYGGRGITVCGEWMDKRTGMNKFIEHVGEKPSKFHSIDRINNNGNYEPGNVRWADRSEQSNNQRKRLRMEKWSTKDIVLELKRRGVDAI